MKSFGENKKNMSVVFFLADIRSRGKMVWWLAAPRWLRLAWALDVAVPPPLFWTPRANFLVHCYFMSTVALTLSLASGLLGTRMVQLWPMTVHLAIALGWGVFIGLLARWYYPRKAQAMNLPPWSEYYFKVFLAKLN